MGRTQFASIHGLLFYHHLLLLAVLLLLLLLAVLLFNFVFLFLFHWVAFDIYTTRVLFTCWPKWIKNETGEGEKEDERRIPYIHVYRLICPTANNKIRCIIVLPTPFWPFFVQNPFPFMLFKFSFFADNILVFSTLRYLFKLCALDPMQNTIFFIFRIRIDLA